MQPPTSALDWLLLTLILLFAFFPGDCLVAVELIRVWIYSRFLNYYLMFQAWLIYRKLRVDMLRIGMSIPPFKFVPIWQRQPPQRKP
jgi:hypothetical protein